MAGITIPYRPSGSDTKDISQIVADFDAILAQANGNLEANVNVKTAAAVAQDGTANAEGSSASLARADHKHLQQGVEAGASLPTTGNFVGRLFFQTGTNILYICTNAGGSGTFRAVMRGNGTAGSIPYDIGGGVGFIGAPSTGQILGESSGVPTWRIPGRGVIKTADTARANTTVLANDPHLTIPVIANETIVVEGILFADGSSAGDLSIDIALPAGADGRFLLLGPATSETVSSTTGMVVRLDAFSAAAGSDRGMLDTAAIVGLPFKGSAIIAANAGSLTLKWAQRVSNATATTLKTFSYLNVTRIS